MKSTPTPIVYIITKLELGGAQKICLSLFLNQQKQGHPVYLISGSEGPLVELVKDKPGVFLLASFKREIGIKLLWHEIKNLFALKKILTKLKQQHPDILVHTHSTKAGLVGRWAAWIAGIKKRVHTIHGFAFHQHQSLIKTALLYLPELITSFITTRFICVSSADQEKGKSIFPKFAKKSSIIRAAVDWNNFYEPARRASKFPEQEEPFVFGTISCFKPQKNIFDLLQAFHEVHKNNPATRLEIVGDGHLRPAIESWIANHHLNGSVLLHGWHDDVRPFLARWHAFVLSSLWEGLPCAIVEARLFKLPILSYNTGGIKDVVFHGKNGFLYQQKQWIALAEGMTQLAKNPRLFASLQKHEDNLWDFADTVMLDQHNHLYQEITTTTKEQL